MIPPFKKLRSDDQNLQKVQDSIAPIFTSLSGKQIIDGAMIENISIVTGTVKSISHGLGKEPRGWIVIKKNANSDVYESTSSTPKTLLDLNATANVTVSLWVF